MDVKIYTTNQTLFQNTHSVVFRYFEYVLLFIVAAIGLLCSAFALADNSSLPQNNDFKQVVSFDLAKKSEFDKYVTISGDKKTGSELSFEISLDLKASRYVMEMGDGRRMILTQPAFTYKYENKGEYVLELKEIQKGLIVVVGDKKLKIK
jgi:hypothetical protein